MEVAPGSLGWFCHLRGILRSCACFSWGLKEAPDIWWVGKNSKGCVLQFTGKDFSTSYTSCELPHARCSCRWSACLQWSDGRIYWVVDYALNFWEGQLHINWEKTCLVLFGIWLGVVPCFENIQQRSCLLVFELPEPPSGPLCNLELSGDSSRTYEKVWFDSYSKNAKYENQCQQYSSAYLLTPSKEEVNDQRPVNNWELTYKYTFLSSCIPFSLFLPYNFIRIVKGEFQQSRNGGHRGWWTLASWPCGALSWAEVLFLISLACDSFSDIWRWWPHSSVHSWVLSFPEYASPVPSASSPMTWLQDSLSLLLLSTAFSIDATVNWIETCKLLFQTCRNQVGPGAGPCSEFHQAEWQSLTMETFQWKE